MGWRAQVMNAQGRKAAAEQDEDEGTWVSYGLNFSRVWYDLSYTHARL